MFETGISIIVSQTIVNNNLSSFMCKFSLIDLAENNLPQQILDYIPVGEQNATSLANELSKKYGQHVNELCNKIIGITRSENKKSQLVRLRFLAEEVTKLFAKHSACASGCNHCCHINVAVSLPEAKLIAKSKNLSISNPQKTFSLTEISNNQSYFNVPCTFLINGKCSIYEVRPVMCKTLINMDCKDTLCKLIPNKMVPVPYYNATLIHTVLVAITINDNYADIRDWFPTRST